VRVGVTFPSRATGGYLFCCFPGPLVGIHSAVSPGHWWVFILMFILMFPGPMVGIHSAVFPGHWCVVCCVSWVTGGFSAIFPGHLWEVFTDLGLAHLPCGVCAGTTSPISPQVPDSTCTTYGRRLGSLFLLVSWFGLS